MGVFEEAFLTTAWEREPDAWDATVVTNQGGQQIVFHLVALRNSNLVWCGYLGYPGWLPFTDEQFRPVEACAHAGECTGSLSTWKGAPRAPWPGYLYPGFDCGHIGDWAPGLDTLEASCRAPANYRTLDYVQDCLYEMARVFAEQVDPELVEAHRRIEATMDAEEALDWPSGPRPLL